MFWWTVWWTKFFHQSNFKNREIRNYNLIVNLYHLYFYFVNLNCFKNPLLHLWSLWSMCWLLLLSTEEWHVCFKEIKLHLCDNFSCVCFLFPCDHTIFYWQDPVFFIALFREITPFNVQQENTWLFSIHLQPKQTK